MACCYRAFTRSINMHVYIYIYMYVCMYICMLCKRRRQVWQPPWQTCTAASSLAAVALNLTKSNEGYSQAFENPFGVAQLSTVT